MKNYVVHPSADAPLTEPQKRWRSYQALVNKGLITPANHTERDEKYKAKRKAARKQNRLNKKGNK